MKPIEPPVTTQRWNQAHTPAPPKTFKDYDGAATSAAHLDSMKNHPIHVKKQLAGAR